MYIIYKQGFLFTGVNDKWEGRHLVLNEIPAVGLSTNFTMAHI